MWSAKTSETEGKFYITNIRLVVMYELKYWANKTMVERKSHEAEMRKDYKWIYSRKHVDYTSHIELEEE